MRIFHYQFSKVNIILEKKYVHKSLAFSRYPLYNKLKDSVHKLGLNVMGIKVSSLRLFNSMPNTMPLP